MESFDNSHLFGTFYVGGMVVFDDFLPNKDLYRKYKISTDVKDDLGAMREVIYRRYFKTLMEEAYKPDLIVMDGGELQISACKEILDSLNLNIPIIGLVKDNKHRTNHIMNENYEILDVDKDSKLFLFLTRIQDEVHRYAITYHRNIKAKGALSSVLDVIPGIGEVRKKELLKKFGSLKKMKEASIRRIKKYVGKRCSRKIIRIFKRNIKYDIIKIGDNMKNNKGFTIVELLAVIAILGILMGIAMKLILDILNIVKKSI